MDISGISNNNALISATKTNIQKEEALTNSFEAALKAAAESQDDHELMNACKEFEAYFLGVMFKQMRSSVSVGSTAIQKSQTENVFQEMLDEEYAKDAADKGSLGLANFMYKQMKRAYGATVPL